MAFDAAEARCAALHDDTPGSFKPIYAQGAFAKKESNVLEVTKTQLAYSIVPSNGMCRDAWGGQGNIREKQLSASGSTALSHLDCRAECEKVSGCVAYSYKFRFYSHETHRTGFCMLHGEGVHTDCPADWTCRARSAAANNKDPARTTRQQGGERLG